MSTLIESFRAAIESAGLIPPEVIRADGKLHRFSTNGKRRDDAGWYTLHEDGIPAGSFGDWRSGLSQTWRAEIGRALTPAEASAHREKMIAIRREHQSSEAKRKAKASAEATATWQAATPADNHPYLISKGIKTHGARVHNGALVIPMREGDTLHSLQFIAEDGAKRFLSGGRVRGCYYIIGTTEGATALCIAEGFATGATIHEATGYPVAVAFNAGNLEPVARALRTKLPDVALVVCADDDIASDGNPGITKATEAARAVGGQLLIPDFGSRREPGMTDFNDVASVRGKEAVAQAVKVAEVAKVATPDEVKLSVSEPVKVAEVARVATPDEVPKTMEPEPLRAPLPPAEPYPVDMLGDVLGGAAKALHDSVKAPLALCCQSVLAAASFATQPHYDVKLPWGERKPLSLFLLTVGDSGERKSGIDNLVLGAAKAQERADMEVYAHAQKTYQADMAAGNQATESARKVAAGGKKGAATASEIKAAVERCGDEPTAPSLRCASCLIPLLRDSSSYL